jgi:hypothetical protein
VSDIIKQLRLDIPLTENQQECVDKLREVLEEAERGNINTIGIVCCMKTGFGATMAGTDAAQLNLGLDSLKAAILDRIDRPRIITQ